MRVIYKNLAAGPHRATIQNHPGAWGPLHDAGPQPHPLSDATFGSDTARHAGTEAFSHLLPAATAACCRAHGVDDSLHSDVLTIGGQGPLLRGLMMGHEPLQPDTDTVVLFLGGCGAPAAACAAPVAPGYLAEGAHLCVVDYRGFGRSAGAPSVTGLHQDGLRMLVHLIEVMGVPKEHIVLHGYAQGADVAADLAAHIGAQHRGPLGGLVLDRPMASVLAPVAADQGTGLGYLSGLLEDDVGEAADEAHRHGDTGHISRTLQRVDPSTFTVLLCGDKDSLGVSGEHLQGILERCGFTVEQAHLCFDTAAGGYDVYTCAQSCIEKLCQHIRAQSLA